MAVVVRAKATRIMPYTYILWGSWKSKIAKGRPLLAA
jgi:hypothetical protein